MGRQIVLSGGHATGHTITRRWHGGAGDVARLHLRGCKLLAMRDRGPDNLVIGVHGHPRSRREGWTYLQQRSHKARRFVASTADGFHSTGVDVGPTLRHCGFSRLLDDYFNVQSNLLLVMATNGNGADDSLYSDPASSDPASAPTLLTIVHPHTNDQLVDGFTDLLYSTAEPLRRERPGIDCGSSTRSLLSG